MMEVNLNFLKNIPDFEASRKFKSIDFNFYVNKWYYIVQKYYDKLIYNEYFGFSKNNKGMPTTYTDPRYRYDTIEYMREAPIHEKSNYDEIKAMSWKEVFLGQPKPMNHVELTPISNIQEGFYGFQHLNYQNIYTLPDHISAFIQLQFGLIDYEIAQECVIGIYDFLIFYSAMWNLRILLSFYLYINVYTIPWSWFASSLDWIEDIFGGMAPSLFGASTFGIIVSMVIGRTADALHHLVLTMPYLPSEAEWWDKELPDAGDTYAAFTGIMPTEKLIKYHYFPRLWYFYGIPDKLRVEWFEENITRMEYYYKFYGPYGIQVLPDYVLDEFPEWKDTKNLNWDIITKIVLLPEKTIECLHETFDKQLEFDFSTIDPAPIVKSVSDSVPISFISESVNIHFSFINLIDPDLIILKTKSFQESGFISQLNLVQQHFDFYHHIYL